MLEKPLLAFIQTNDFQNNACLGLLSSQLKH